MVERAIQDLGLVLNENPVVPVGDIWRWRKHDMPVYVRGNGASRFRDLRVRPYDNPKAPVSIVTGTAAELALIDPKDPYTLYITLEDE
jgi:hypothetical protein